MTSEKISNPDLDYRNKEISCPLSAGINSMAVLCWLAKYEFRPKNIYIFYSHFKEHSPESLEFVLSGVDYAKKHFDKVIFEYTENSIIDFFAEKKMIPHPTFAPCTYELKIKPAHQFLSKHNCTVDLVGYVRSEKRRIKNMISKGVDDLFLQKHFPISHITDQDCFDLVKQEIGWYPKIYDLKWDDTEFVTYVNTRIESFDQNTQKTLKNKLGTSKRVFKHNNCLPCKNMRLDDILAVEYFYPEFYKNAMQLSDDLKSHWGRDKDSFTDAFMVTFGREEWETEGGCEVCKF